jgi:glutamate-5-semialdehyde dehydrogenase
MSIVDTASHHDEGLKTPDMDIDELMLGIGRDARRAARALALADTGVKNLALMGAAAAIRRQSPDILAANVLDVDAMTQAGGAASFIDRLTLTPERIDAIAVSLEEIAALPDPVGSIIGSWTRPNGLRIDRVRTPLGVIGIIYESRPNVTADAGGLCLKAGNAAILRGGSDSFRSSGVIHRCLVEGLTAAGLPAESIQIVPTRDRAAVGTMLTGLDGAIDVIVPRGGRSLVERVQNEARVPVFAHLEGVCHVYIHSAANPAMAVAVAVNSKMRRVGICGAAETLLIDQDVAVVQLPAIISGLREAGCQIRGDERVRSIIDGVEPATEADWACEYLDRIISVAVVDDLSGAIGHIETYGSHHTDTIITADDGAAERFMAEIDSAIVLHNASTQFADGGEFGMGAEIGIATGRMHARGPVGVEQLTSFKYTVHGTGQVRP